MSKKVFNVFSILCFALVLCFIGCTELINPKTETDINLNIDLSKIMKSTRNTGETQSSASIGENPTIKVAIYDAKKYNATTNLTDNLDLITEAQAKIENNKAKVKLNNIPVGIYAIVFAELSFSNENSTEVMYAGNSEVFKVEATDNKISLVLKKVEVDIEVKPDDSKPEEIINAKEPIITTQPESHIKIYSSEIGDDFTYELKITAESSDDGKISYKWQKLDNENWVDIENSSLDKITVTVSKNTSCVYRCVVTNTNENVNGEKTASIYSNEVTVAHVEGSLASITAKYTGSYELLGKDFTYSNVSVTETYTSSDDAIKPTPITVIADESRYTISPNTEDAIGYVPYTVSYKDTTLPSSPTASLKVPVKYELDANNLVLETCFNSSSVSVSDTENKINIPQYGTVKYVYQISDNDAISFIEKNNTEIKDINSIDSDEQYFKATITSDGTNIENEATCYDVGKYTYIVTLESANEWFICNSTISKDFSVEVCPWKISLTLSESTSTVDPNNISPGTYALSISNKAYIGTSQNPPSATFSCLVNNNNIISDDQLKISDNDFTKGTIKASIKINEEEVEVASLEISRENTSVTYAEGLTCYVQDDTVTLYISSADGLATFRDIVNGSLPKEIIVQYKSNPNSTHEFNADNEYQNVNAVLERDITLSGEWTPIGVYSNESATAKPYSGTFDGNGKTVKFENITHESSAMYSSGLFQMLAGTVKNLIIDGSIFRTEVGYIGSITGYLDGGTIENCVNKALITNSASIGTGGIVGYVGTAGGKITGCINLEKVLSQSSVGGIVGNVGNMSVNSNLTISKCINLGEISGESNISGILGNANTSAISIYDCMNIGTILANNTLGPAYASGITTPSEDYTVSSCINVGQVTAAGTNSFQGGISSVTTKGNYTNNYYDSTVNSSVVVDSNTDGISGKLTSELIALTSVNLSDQWSFVSGRYPLPDIAGNIPGGENGLIWQTVKAAATPGSPSASGGGIDGTIQSLSDLSSYYDSTNECYSLTSGTYIFGKNLQLDKPLYILSGNDVTICSDTAVTITSSFSDDNLVYIDRQDEENYGTLTLGSGDGVLTLKHENSTYPTIASYGELKLENNCAITGSNYCAINIYNGNFYMNGGEIYGNKYSGSNIQSSAVNLLFTYDSIDSSSAEFYGGKIYNNETTTSGGAIAYIGDATPRIELTGIEIYNNKANISGGGIYSNTANLYVNSESRIYDNYVNGSKQGASIFVEDLINGNYFYMDYVDAIDTPYTEDIGL